MTIESTIKELNDRYHAYLKACEAEGKKPLSYRAWQNMPEGEFRGSYE